MKLSTNRNLTGKRILVTRPEPQADTLCQRIESMGGVAVRLPVILIQPPENKKEVLQLLEDLSRFDYGIFISQNAVYWALELMGHKLQALQNMKLFAIGPATAAALKNTGLKNIMYARDMATSELLLELPELQKENVNHKNILIFRGNGGRDKLSRTLGDRGAKVNYAEVYHRKIPEYKKTFLEEVVTAGNLDVIVITSSEGLLNLSKIMETLGTNPLVNTQLVVMSKRIAENTKQLGYKKLPLIASTSSDEGILDAIIQSVRTGAA